jgi:hypothetical protein
MQSISHQINLAKKGTKGRRCLTEICRKVDGSDKKGPQVNTGENANAKGKAKAREGEQVLMLYTYTASCQEIFFL